MRSTKLRIMSACVLVAGALALTGVTAPGASAADGDLHVSITSGPTDAAAGERITAVPFDPTGGPDSEFVSVHVSVEEFDGETTTFRDALPGEVEVKFRLAISSDLEGGEAPASGTPTVGTELTGEGGIATFDGSLSITPPNEPLTSAYYLVPQARYASEITLLEEGWPFEGVASAGFDVWGDGCRGAHCQTTLTPPDKTTIDTYETTENVGMGTSVIETGGTILNCPDQKVVFDTVDLNTQTLFFHVTGGNGAVFLFSHITRHDMKEAVNNGQRHVGWCVGLKSAGPWNFTRQDTNDDGTIDTGPWVTGSDLWVGMAPKCPRKNAIDFAPCIVSKMSDDNGGSFIRGYLPGGDPPRRT